MHSVVPPKNYFSKELRWKRTTALLHLCRYTVYALYPIYPYLPKMLTPLVGSRLTKTLDSSEIFPYQIKELYFLLF